MTYQLANAKVWDGSQWVAAKGGGGGGLSLLGLVERAGSINVSANASANTKGAWTELIASADGDANWIWVYAAAAVSGQNGACLLDIGVGAAGAEQVIVENVAIGWSNLQKPMAFPVAVASGSRVAVRIQHFTGSTTVPVALSLFDGGTDAPASLDTIGADTAASRGTNLPSNNTYVQLTASTSQAYKAIIAIPCGGSSVSNPSAAAESSTYTLGSGAAGSESTLLAFAVETTTAESLVLPVGSWVPIYAGTVAAGTRLAVKQSVGRNYRDVVLYGVPA